MHSRIKKFYHIASINLGKLKLFFHKNLLKIMILQKQIIHCEQIKKLGKGF